jgi:hypothetical protein
MIGIFIKYPSIYLNILNISASVSSTITPFANYNAQRCNIIFFYYCRMDTLSVVATNALEGVIGGAASVWPVLGVSLCFQAIQIYISFPLKYGQQKANSVFQYSIASLGLGVAGGIVGGMLADNYDNSIYNGINYGAVTTLLVSIYGSIMIYYT